ncbi:hypothetical protein K458DRAFT_269039, partial [Lentithecium fluviatile CBS 122367]
SPQYVPYRPPGSEFTPPASPQPPNGFASPTKTGFGSGRANQPGSLQVDVPEPPAYERPQYSPSPSASPPLPPLPSPKFTSRQRAPSLLRHAAVPSPLNDGFPRAEQPASSPTFPPHMIRQASAQSTASDPRSIFNPLASNPVSSHVSSYDSSMEDLSGIPPQQRMRGMTTTSQSSFHPPLRSATSIPDYGPIRTSSRSNLSGAYRPNRGGPNWSHNEHCPPRYFRGEEARASFRSGWTNASSSFMEASGTERSSMATGRSSISDNRTSTYSRDRSEERELSSDTLPTTADLEEEDIMSTVEDVIDSYFDEEDSLEDQYLDEDQYLASEQARDSSAPPSDTNRHTRSSSYSQDGNLRMSFHSSDRTSQPDQPLAPPNPEQQTYSSSESAENFAKHLSIPSHPALEVPGPLQNQEDHHISYLPPLQLSPLQLNYPTEVSAKQNVEQEGAQNNERDVAHPHNDALQRASEEIPRRTSTAPRASRVGLSSASNRLSKPLPRPRLSRNVSNDGKMQEIHEDLKGLPQLPRNKSRLSRQDWAEIQAYSNRNSKGPSAALRSLEGTAPQPSPPKISSPLPEVDEEEAFPRRASTSVFDRRSNMFDLSMFNPTPPSKSKTTEFGSTHKAHPTGPAATLRKPLSPSERDRYGFKKATDKISLHEYNTWFSKYDEHVLRRRNKWIALMKKEGLSIANPSQFPEPCEKVKRYARKGYPPEWRGAMWWFYSGGQQRIRDPDMAGLYPSLVARVKRGELNKDDREAIERDLDRTFPDNIHFRPDPSHIDDGDDDESGPDEPSLIKDLREVLSAFALNNPGIGYCQSLNFIAGLLLLFLKQDTERVFVLMSIITQKHLPGAHARSLANTEVNVLMMLIRDYLPKVWNSINDTDLVNSGPGSKAHPNSKFQRQPTVALSCLPWFMGLFVSVLPIETVLRVWDAFLYEGPRALYRYALAIFKLGEPEIRKYRPGDGELFMTVQNLPRRCINPNVLHDIAFVKKGFGSLTQNVIDQKRQFWREQSERAARSTSQKSRNDKQLPVVKADSAVGDDESKRGLVGLRRKASKRF